MNYGLHFSISTSLAREREPSHGGATGSHRPAAAAAAPRLEGRKFHTTIKEPPNWQSLVAAARRLDEEMVLAPKNDPSLITSHLR